VIDWTREDCRNGPRPCPIVSCRHHLLIEVLITTTSVHPAARAVLGDTRLADASPALLERALRALPETCSLDVAEMGEHTFEQIGAVLGCTSQAAGQTTDMTVRRNTVRLRQLHKTQDTSRLSRGGNR
jgi:hypothetical protein